MKQKEVTKMEPKRILPLTSDIVFKRVFGKRGNEDILKALLEAILDIEIKSVTVRNPEIPKDLYDSKAGVLDIKAEINENAVVDIEMQVEDQKNINSRSMFYTASLVTEGVRMGEDYKYIKKTIAINLLDYNFYERNSYHNVAHMMFENTKPEEYVDMKYQEEEKMATEDVEMHFIELPKFIKKNPAADSKLAQWLWLIVGREDKLAMAREENQELEKAIQIIKQMSMNSEEWERFTSRQKAIINYNSGMSQAKEEGLKEGLKEGKKEGREQGERIARQQMAKKLLKLGLKIEDIQEATGFTKEEIEKLKEELEE